MAEHPIPFTAWSIGRILAGGKTQTRRLIRLTKAGKDFKSPYGVKGDYLWCRENFYVQPDLWAQHHERQPLHYAADGDPQCLEDYLLRPAMFMPRWASRITLEGTDVRVERVQEITREDALMEGVGAAGLQKILGTSTIHAQDTFRDLWDSLHGKKPGGSWIANPRVRVLSFRLVKEKP